MATHDRRRGREVAVGVFLLIAAVVDSAEDVELAKAPKGTMKTIDQSGHIVDCVDIYQQPALNQPLLKNHTIQTKPSFSTYQEDENHQKLQGQPSIFDEWGVDCPEGTVPIVRETAAEDFVQPSRSHTMRKLEAKLRGGFFPRPGHEYALVSLIGEAGAFHGARGVHNVWTPPVEPKYEVSASKIWVTAGPPENLNAIEAGWMVDVISNTESKTRFFIYWTNDGYKSTGCFNHKCQGFVQTSNTFGPGSILQGISNWGREQYDITIEIKQDPNTRDWWLWLQHRTIGYWPAKLFTSLGDGAHTISWGGEVTNSREENRHTKTAMGSGKFPRDGYYTKAAYITQLGHIEDINNPNFVQTPSERLSPYMTKRDCYEVVKGPTNRNFGSHIYYGGPGWGNALCP